MTTYIYECDKCKRQFEVMQRIVDNPFTKHADVTEGHEGLPDVCEGNICRVIQPVGIIFKGPGWTPKFHTKAGRKLDKMDRALRAMGVEDASSGWETATEAPKKRPKKKPKYIGQLPLE